MSKFCQDCGKKRLVVAGAPTSNCPACGFEFLLLEESDVSPPPAELKSPRGSKLQNALRQNQNSRAPPPRVNGFPDSPSRSRPPASRTRKPPTILTSPPNHITNETRAAAAPPITGTTNGGALEALLLADAKSLRQKANLIPPDRKAESPSSAPLPMRMRIPRRFSPSSSPKPAPSRPSRGPRRPLKPRVPPRPLKTTYAQSAPTSPVMSSQSSRHRLLPSRTLSPVSSWGPPLPPKKPNSKPPPNSSNSLNTFSFDAKKSKIEAPKSVPSMTPYTPGIGGGSFRKRRRSSQPLCNVNLQDPKDASAAGSSPSPRNSSQTPDGKPKGSKKKSVWDIAMKHQQKLADQKTQKPVTMSPTMLSPTRSVQKQINPAQTSLAKKNQYVEDFKAQLNESDEVLKIQLKFTGDVELVQPNRRFVKHSVVSKMCRGGPREYHLHLFNDILLYSDKTQMGLKLHRCFDLDEIRVCLATSANVQFLQFLPPQWGLQAFVIESLIKSLLICCNSVRERDGWFETIKKHQEAKPEGKLAPLWTPDNLTSACTLCQTGFNLLNRKHHCRECGLIICRTCSPETKVLPQHDEAVRVCKNCVRGINPKDLMSLTAEELNLTPLQVNKSSQNSQYAPSKKDRRSIADKIGSRLSIAKSSPSTSSLLSATPEGGFSPTAPTPTPPSLPARQRKRPASMGTLDYKLPELGKSGGLDWAAFVEDQSKPLSAPGPSSPIVESASSAPCSAPCSPPRTPRRSPPPSSISHVLAHSLSKPSPRHAKAPPRTFPRPKPQFQSRPGSRSAQPRTPIPIKKGGVGSTIRSFEQNPSIRTAPPPSRAPKPLNTSSAPSTTPARNPPPPRLPTGTARPHRPPSRPQKPKKPPVSKTETTTARHPLRIPPAFGSNTSAPARPNRVAAPPRRPQRLLSSPTQPSFRKPRPPREINYKS